MEDSSLQQQHEDDDPDIINIPPEEWKKLIEYYWTDDGIENVTVETFTEQWLEHPKKERFINWKDSSIANGATMLICAVWSGRLDIATLLLQHGADVHIADEDGDTPFKNASHEQYVEMMELLLNKGADINSSDKKGETSLMRASRNGHSDTMKLLLEKGADINIANLDGEAALISATREGKTEAVKLLLSNGADINRTDKKGETALMWASRYGRRDTLKLLLDNGADINIANKAGRTALMKASLWGHTNTVKLLLDKGADVKIVTKAGKTALSLATEEGHDEIALLLQVKVAADPNVCNSNGQTFLHQACMQNMKTLATQVLELGTDKDKLDDYDHTAFFYAAEKGFADIVDLLLKHNADANKTDERRLETGYDSDDDTYSFYSVKDGRTPLFVAAQNGHQKVVASLLQHGADPYLCNNENLTPRDVSDVHGAIQQLFCIHDFFDQREKGDKYEDRYYTCKDSYFGRGYKKPVPPLEDIIHDIVKYPHFADKFVELYKENREIVNWLDKDDRTVQQVACKQCRQAILFMGQYHLDDQPKYESPTCRIYNALDYGGPDENLKQPRKVAMKFMENDEHFLNEMRSRRNADGSPRFSSDFVTPDLAAYRADENPLFAQACKTWQQARNGAGTDFLLGCSCSVMPLAERSLLESMNAENLSAEHKDLQRREILMTLSKIFSYIHGLGFVHGDIKPHNVVRHMDGGNVAWKAIDFDACTKIGDTAGLKLTTGSAPPEMLKIIENKDGEDMCKTEVILRQPGVDGLKESELVKADPSFDVWSYGILMYELLTDSSFFHCDKQGNVVDAGLQELGNLTERRIHEKLESVDDVDARVLLSKILRLNPKKRPTMAEVEQDYYFHPSDSPQGRQSEFIDKKGFDDMSRENLPTLEANETTGLAKDEDSDDNVEYLKRFLSSKSEFSYFNLRDEDKDWSDQLLNSEVKSFRFDKVEGMGEKPKFIDGDTIYNNGFLRGLLSRKGPDYFMGFLVEYFELYKIMHNAHQVCQGIKANLVSDVKSLKGIFIKLFVRGKGLNDIVRGTLFCNSVDQLKYVGRLLKEQYGHNVYIKPPKQEPGAWPIPKLLIYGKKQIDGRCMSVEIQFSTVYMHLAVQASNNHLVYEALRESTGYLIDKDEEFHEFLQSLNRQHIDTEGFLRNESALEGRFEVLVEQVDETDDSGETRTTISQESDKHYTTNATGVILSGRVRCGDLMFRFMKSKDDLQRFSESSFVVNRNLTLLSSHSYWSDESYDLEGKSVEFVVSFKGRGLAIAGIGTEKCMQGTTETAGGGARCSVYVGRSKFVVRKSGVEKVFREKKLPDQERARIVFKMKDGVLLVSFVGSGREGDGDIESGKIILSPDQRYYLYMRAPPGVHDVKFHDINIE